ncbi:helix-turn-helix domain-containing protein [Micromonospora endophytica]|uniref:AraC family transcriptional regulator n=1 Tax=Micromonospora endophytica TaxID=515350 RepID=A0A2W2CYS8_9ACTN|nr:helix-turn-helix domain-containing protein [Micromonospora endophytica]PZF93589.1 AraC family transcriptional regulator [Micromonospora endophytica]RIW49122.1 AraC family transcriptional regulator [Micromonospora endophytica]BCJ59122.1 AraC family transcriptional regulator [Micromonospora endophytica]
MRQPRGDSRGILDPARLMRRVRFRRHLPAAGLQPWVEHYWLIDWTLPEPFAQRVVPHPAVNLVFQRDGDGPERAEVAGVGLEVFSIVLAGTGRVCGVQFRPGGFHPFWHRSVAELTGRRLNFAELVERWPPAAVPPQRICIGTDAARCRALDALLTGWAPRPDPATDETIRLVEAIRTDRSVRRVDEFARDNGLSIRQLQRLFLTRVGVGPKWVIRRYRLHEALERATDGPLDWARLAAELGYSDQAHLVRDFTAVTGRSPSTYTLTGRRERDAGAGAVVNRGPFLYTRR